MDASPAGLLVLEDDDGRLPEPHGPHAWLIRQAPVSHCPDVAGGGTQGPGTSFQVAATAGAMGALLGLGGEDRGQGSRGGGRHGQGRGRGGRGGGGSGGGRGDHDSGRHGHQHHQVSDMLKHFALRKAANLELPRHSVLGGPNRNIAVCLQPSCRAAVAVVRRVVEAGAVLPAVGAGAATGCGRSRTTRRRLGPVATARTLTEAATGSNLRMVDPRRRPTISRRRSSTALLRRTGRPMATNPTEAVSSTPRRRPATATSSSTPATRPSMLRPAAPTQRPTTALATGRLRPAHWEGLRDQGGLAATTEVQAAARLSARRHRTTPQVGHR